MIRKIFLIALVCMMVMGLVACGGGEDTSEPTDSPYATPGQIVITLEPQAGANEIYQLTQTKQIMSYMIKTKNNSLIMLDGGEATDYKQIIALAKHLTGDEVPVIDAWLFSHSHSDHVNAFTELMNEAPEALDIKKIYHHITTEEYMLLNEPTNKTSYRRFVRALKKYDESGANIVVVEEGQKFTYDGIEIEVLLIPDETLKPLTGAVINDSSVVYRMTIDGQSVLFLGDAYHQSGDRLIQKYGDNLASDVVQMAHHGSQGVQKAVYDKIAPKVCLWPAPAFMWDDANQIKGDGGLELETVELHSYMTKKLKVKTHIIARDGLQKLTFPLELS